MRLGSYGLRCTPVSFLGDISPHTIGAHQMVDCGRETRRCDMFGHRMDFYSSLLFASQC